MHLLSLKDLTASQVNDLVKLAEKIKANQKEYSGILEGKTLTMIFQKTSTRTRMSFEAGMTQLGGHAIFLDWLKTNFTLGGIADEIKCIEKYSDIIMARVYKHGDLVEMANAINVPLMNGLCNLYHPCQILSDLLTIKEKKGKLEGLSLAFIGDGNNVCNSLIIGGAKAGMNVNVATPEGHEPLEDAVKVGKMFGKYKHFTDPKEAVKGADIVYTDTWISMGEENQKERKMKAFKGFQVNGELLNGIDPIVMHCLPAHRGYEISDEVLDSENSVVFDQAENRMHMQKAIMVKLLGED
ncbi:MAG: ornithine carbamoyltransferase [Candidatus Diapherotrites archaeon]